MKKYLVEFIGTLLPRLHGRHGRAQRRSLAPFAIGTSLMVMVFAGGHVSGGHFNPAVTLAVFIRGKCDTKDVLPYWLAQFAAGLVAALLVTFIFSGKPAAPALHGTVPSVIVEFLFTFALGWVVFEHGDPQKHGRQFLLWSCDRHDGDDRRGRGRRHIRRRFQPGRRLGRVYDGPGVGQAVCPLFGVRSRRGRGGRVTYKFVHGRD